MKDYSKVTQAQKNYVMPTYAPGLMLIKGEGSYVWDSNDRKYLDFTCGISVCNIGHCHPKVSEAVKKQVDKLVHVSNLFVNEYQPILAEELTRNSFDGKVFFSNSGAEANEGMIKFARKWGNPKGRNEIITMNDSFHGRTLATLAATGRSKYRKGFEPAVKGFHHVPFNDINAIKKVVENPNNNIAAVLLEPIQGEGGIIPANREYLKSLRKYCTDNEILLLMDEVQSGMGRTGKFFGHQQYDVIPDVMTIAKALGNGYPIGAVIARKSLGDVLETGTHASTFGGTPLACSAALATLQVYKDDNVLQNCEKMGFLAKELLTELKNRYDIIKEIRGYGLMLGIQLKEKASEVTKIAQDEGLLIITAGENVLRFYPPLNINENDLKKGISIIDTALSKI
ncbi:MAG TPA: aspartate aminotransferase family protein [Victivallales bacterium]|nr:aspartate aminotransferase family protein [Victivallales bacterium]